MGRYSFILVSTLLLLLTYFVISTSNTSKATVHRNVETYHYNNARNVAMSATQVIIQNIINGNPGWVFSGYPDGEITGRPLTDFAEWDELNGQYRIKSMEKNHNDLYITITGKSAARQYNTSIHFRRVTAQGSLFNYAAYSYGDMTIGNNGIIDSFNPAAGGMLNGNAHIGYGPEGSFTNNGTLNGTVSHRVDKEMPAISAPGGGVDFIIENFSQQIEAGDYNIIGDIVLSGNTNIQIMGETVFYVPGNIRTTGNSKITIEPEASLTIFLGGTLDTRGNGLYNATGEAQNLIIYGLPDCTSIDIQGSNNGQFRGAIYAPNADITVRGGNNFTLFGSIIGNNVDIFRRLYYDESLADLAEYGVGDIFTAWHLLSWK